MKKTKYDLNIVMRTCLKSKLSDELPQSLVRVCGPNRSEMIIRCLTSLIRSIKKSSAKIKLTVLDDNSDPVFLKQVKGLLTNCDSRLIDLKVPAAVKSFNYSAYEQFRLVSECDGLVYSVEDDYLHEENAIDFMIAAYHYLTNRFYNDNIMLFPYDCPFRYGQGKEEPTLLLHDGTRYWRQVNQTSNTFLTNGKLIKKHFGVFSKLALEYPNVTESETINLLYKRFGISAGDITVFSPIPSVAFHLSYEPPVEIKTEHLTWKTLWDSIPEMIKKTKEDREMLNATKVNQKQV